MMLAAALLVIAYVLNNAMKKGFLPSVPFLGGSGGKLQPLAMHPDVPLPRAKPKKVEVRIDRGDDDEQPTIEIPTKDLSSVQDFGELVYELMVSELDIEEPFKLYYVDNEGDSMLVSAHTSLRDVIYSEAVTAKLDEGADEEVEEAPPRKDKRLVAGGAKLEKLSKESRSKTKDKSSKRDKKSRH